MAALLKDELRRLAALGHTANEAARLAGCATKAARATASRHGFKFQREGAKMAARVAELAAARRTAPEIAAELGICRTHVHRILARTPDGPRLVSKAQRSREKAEAAAKAEEAARMERWHAAWAARKAARAQTSLPTPPPQPLVFHDEAALGAAMRRQAQAERGRRSA